MYWTRVQDVARLDLARADRVNVGGAPEDRDGRRGGCRTFSLVCARLVNTDSPLSHTYFTSVVSRTVDRVTEVDGAANWVR